MYEAVSSGKISGNGIFTKRCQAVLEERTETNKCLLTTSCTDALEMAAILAQIKPGDEVIMPSFTFVSTANAFILRGAKIIFIDSRPDHPGMDETKVEALITDRTKAIVPVHYAGVACDMDSINTIAKKRQLFVVEDAAQAIDSFYTGSDGIQRPLGSIGHFGTLSFHETKNIQCGEGGALLINDLDHAERAEIIWEKGTNRTAFWRGEVDKYGWVDIGSSFLPSDLTSAFLFAQLENTKQIQERRVNIWNQYFSGLQAVFSTGNLKAPFIPGYATNNGHMFYVVCSSEGERAELMEHLKSKRIQSVFHYQSLHASPYFKNKHDGRELKLTDSYSDCLLRLPMHQSLTVSQVAKVVDTINEFFL